jgi:hypothetical protein
MTLTAATDLNSQGCPQSGTMSWYTIAIGSARDTLRGKTKGDVLIQYKRMNSSCRAKGLESGFTVKDASKHMEKDESTGEWILKVHFTN